MSQISVPCVVYRGGTSRGLFFHKRDLPNDEGLRNQIFLYGIGSHDESQINGLGGGTSHTSKVVVIAPSDREGVDVDYTFYQLSMGEEVVDDRGTCGNLMGAAGAFAIDENLVQINESAFSIVTLYNTNTDSIIKVKVPLEDGVAKAHGDYEVPGLVEPGARIEIDILDPSSGVTDSILPLGPTNEMKGEEGTIEFTFTDAVNPVVYVKSESVGLSGTVSTDELKSDPNIISTLNNIRDQATVQTGIAKDMDEARNVYPAVPKIACVSEPQDYVTTSGKLVKKEEVDILAKMISMSRVHRTFAGSGLMNLAASVLLEGTIPNKVTNVPSSATEIRIGHPDGVAVIRCSLKDNQQDVESVGYDRTARRLIKGELFVPKKK
ncbi:PrpF domain-containing protein [Alkalibacillus silvisoli]|uniref:2-methylaconitate cis-trans isomerase PrpF n=1 Tax=Alkalibacillus silvisoli TaxID=392823 RepID=A0ABN1A7J0_9BACI